MRNDKECEMDDFAYMERAIALAKEAAAAGEVPVGAVVVDRETGEILGTGRNRCEECSDPFAHAELIAMHEAAKLRGGKRLADCTLYVTLEPCPMCAGAMRNARVGRLVFGAYDPRAGAVISADRVFARETCDYHPRVTEGLLEYPCAALLRDFFGSLRGSH